MNLGLGRNMAWFYGLRPLFVLPCSVMAILLLSGTLTWADTVNWSVTLDNPDQFGLPGSTLTYTGTIVNNTGTDLLLDTAAINFSASVPAADYVKDYADQFLATLGDIPTSGYSGPLFFITWLPVTPLGAAGSGTFDLTAPAQPSLISSPFTASTTAVPEPSSFILCCTAILLPLAIKLGRRSTNPRRN